MKKKSKGLGDSVEKALKSTGIDKVVKKLLGDDCGCEERKEKLNKLFPYKKARQFTKDEKSVYERVLPSIKKGEISRQEQGILVGLYNNVFKTNKRPSSCSSCVRETTSQLAKIYENTCDH
tara:strand:- start:87 stop:449 length:363 start_codon:yes stop_codon:yes gene_type:complete